MADFAGFLLHFFTARLRGLVTPCPLGQIPISTRRASTALPVLTLGGWATKSTQRASAALPALTVCQPHPRGLGTQIYLAHLRGSASRHSRGLGAQIYS